MSFLHIESIYCKLYIYISRCSMYGLFTYIWVALGVTFLVNIRVPLSIWDIHSIYIYNIYIYLSIAFPGNVPQERFPNFWPSFLSWFGTPRAGICRSVRVAFLFTIGRTSLGKKKTTQNPWHFERKDLFVPKDPG